MQLLPLIAALSCWWRGTWLGRIAMFQFLWGGFAIALMIAEPHPAGFTRRIVLFNLIVYGVIAWLVAAMPAYAKGAGFTVRWRWGLRAVYPNSGGSTALLVQAVRLLGRVALPVARGTRLLPRSR